MRPSLAVSVFALGAGACILATLSVPNVSERVAMLRRDGRDEAAVAIANAAYEMGKGGDLFLSSVFEVNSRSGDTETARQAIGRYLALHRDNAIALRRAADFFAANDGSAHRIAMLVRLTELRSEPGDISELARLYRLEGRFEDELTLLDRFHGVQLPPELFDRWERLSTRKRHSEKMKELAIDFSTDGVALPSEEVRAIH